MVDTPIPPPSRTRLKRILLYAARHFIPGGGFHDGPVEVLVSQPGSDSAIIVPDADADGLTAPSGVRVTQTPAGEGPTHSELVEVLYCDNGLLILRELASRQPCQAQEVLAAVGDRIGKSNFWPLWKSYQVRGLIADGSAGFQLGKPWLRGMLGGSGGLPGPGS